MKVQSVMRTLRERADLSQTDLATLLGRAQPEVSMWEWGKEAMPEHIRNQVWGILLARLGETYSLIHGMKAADLDRPWDEVLAEF